jgi:hypothetical protein
MPDFIDDFSGYEGVDDANVFLGAGNDGPWATRNWGANPVRSFDSTTQTMSIGVGEDVDPNPWDGAWVNNMPFSKGSTTTRLRMFQGGQFLHRTGSSMVGSLGIKGDMLAANGAGGRPGAQVRWIVMSSAQNNFLADPPETGPGPIEFECFIGLHDANNDGDGLYDDLWIAMGGDHNGVTNDTSDANYVKIIPDWGTSLAGTKVDMAIGPIGGNGQVYVNGVKVIDAPHQLDANFYEQTESTWNRWFSSNLLVVSDTNVPSVNFEFQGMSLVHESEVLGDFNYNGMLDANDPDFFFAVMEKWYDNNASFGHLNMKYDRNLDGNVDASDLATVILLGDASLDGQVDTTDLARLAANWKSMDANWALADFNHDGVVDTTDLAILAANWKAGGPTKSSPVPEPVSLTVLVLGAAGILRRRK